MTDVDPSVPQLWLTTGNLPALLLNGDTADSAGYNYTIEALADDATWDNPQPIDVAVQRWMTDGAAASTQGLENREPYFKVVVSADSSVDLAAGEAALVKRSGRSGTLKWVPPQGTPDAPASVFELWTWHLEHILDDIDELQLQRTYGLRMTAKPSVRSDDLTIVAALPSIAVPTITSIDACNSTTGWDGAPNGPSTAGGAVIESNTVTTGGSVLNTSLSLTRTGAVSMGSLPYLVIDFSVTGITPSGTAVLVDSQVCTRVATLGNVTYWALPTGVTSFTTLDVLALISVPAHKSVTLKLAVNDVSKTDSPGGVGSHMQLFRNMDVGGSVKTSGSIQVASPSATALGTVQVYTRSASAAGYVPAMRRYRTSGGGLSTDTTCVSGFRETFVTSGSSVAVINFVVPANQLREGTYAVVGRFKNSSAVANTINVQLSIATGSGVAQTVTVPVSWSVFGGLFSLTTLATMALPTQQLPSESNQATNITLLGSGGSGQQWLDELYLYDLTRGDLTIIKAVNATRLWIDAPDVDPVRNRMAIYTGAAADRSDAIGAAASQIMSVGVHDLDPDGASMLTVTDGVNDAAVTASFYRRWHTHAGT